MLPNHHSNDPDPSEYLAAEIAHLRSTYVELGRETRSLEQYAMLAAGAIWGWCAANDTPASRVFACVPFIVTQLAGLRAWGLYRTMGVIRRYLQRAEDAAHLPDGLGSQRFLRERPAASLQFWTALVFWVVLSLASIAAPIALGWTQIAS